MWRSNTDQYSLRGSKAEQRLQPVWTNRPFRSSLAVSPPREGDSSVAIWPELLHLFKKRSDFTCQREAGSVGKGSVNWDVICLLPNPHNPEDLQWCAFSKCKKQWTQHSTVKEEDTAFTSLRAPPLTWVGAVTWDPSTAHQGASRRCLMVGGEPSGTWVPSSAAEMLPAALAGCSPSLLSYLYRQGGGPCRVSQAVSSYSLCAKDVRFPL